MISSFKLLFTWERLRWSDAGVQCEWRGLTVSRTIRVDGGSELISFTHRQAETNIYCKCAKLDLPGMLTLPCEHWVQYHSPWTSPATADCGGDRDTEWRADQAARPAPDSTPSSYIQQWACTVSVTSTDRDKDTQLNTLLDTCAPRLLN